MFRRLRGPSIDRSRISPTHKHLFDRQGRDSVRQVIFSWYVFRFRTTRLDTEQLPHKSDVRDRQAQGFDPREPFLVSERRYLKSSHGETCESSLLWSEKKIKRILRTFLRSLSKASFRLNILRLSRIFAALLWETVATRRLGFFVVDDGRFGERPFGV